MRVDSGFAEGDEIGVNYDPLIAKLITYAETRTLAIERAKAALRCYPILGIRTNVDFLLRLLDDGAFRQSEVHTHYIDDHLQELVNAANAPVEAVAAAGLAAERSSRASATGQSRATPDPWSSAGGWGR